MRILLVNDDGFGEPGLTALEEIFSDHDTFTVAPHFHHSGAGMSLNLYSPLVVRDYGNSRFSVEGTPVDCLKLALSELCGGKPPELVISGINPGANVANNTWYSGTVAAATEAAFWLVPAIAVSQEYRKSPDFSEAARVTRKLVDEGLHRSMEPGTFLNVNIPSSSPRGYRFTRIGHFAREIPFTRVGQDPVFRYGPYEMQPVREETGTDVHAIQDGFVSISLLSSARHHPSNPGEISSWCSRQL